MASTQRVVLDGATTWTVVSDSFSVVDPIERDLEFGRQSGFKPNTIKAYARGLAQWWTYLEHTSKQWDAVQIRDFGNFIAAVRHNEFDPTTRQLRPKRAVVEGTVRLRLRAVLGFYRYHAGCGNDVAPFLYNQVYGRSGSYVSFLDHVAKRNPQRRDAVRVRVPRKEVPVLAPDVITDLLDVEATYSPDDSEWHGDLRYRLLWSLLAETGMRIGEALSLQHRDWNTARSLPPRCRSSTDPTRTGSQLSLVFVGYISAVVSIASMGITSGGCATKVPTRWSTTGIAATSSATRAANPFMRHCVPKPSTLTCGP